MFAKVERILFLHTGGSAALFGYDAHFGSGAGGASMAAE